MSCFVFIAFHGARGEKNPIIPVFVPYDLKTAGTYVLSKEEKGPVLPEAKPLCADFLKNLKTFEDKPFMRCKLLFSETVTDLRPLDWQSIDVKTEHDFLLKLIKDRYYLHDTFYLNLAVNEFNAGLMAAEKAVVQDLIPGKENVIIRIYPKRCSHGNTSVISILEKDGKTLEPFAAPFAQNGKQQINYRNTGELFYYKDKLFHLRTMHYDVNKEWDAAMEVSVLSSGGTGVMSLPLCHYSWKKAYNTPCEDTTYCN